MKYIHLGILFILCGCTQVEVTEEFDEQNKITVAIQFKPNESLRTTPSSDLSIMSAKVLVYNSNEILENSTSTTSGNSSAVLTLKEGHKYIYVVANASSDLTEKIKNAHFRKDLLELTSEAEDYNNGQLPSHGLLMAGEYEGFFTTNQNITVTLTAALTKIEVYVAKESNVGNIIVKKVEGKNLHTTGYLFSTDVTESKTDLAMQMPSGGPITIKTNDITGKLVGTVYSYPTIKATDLSVQLTVRHAEAQTDDVYTIIPNAQNSSAEGVTLERGKCNKITITFKKDEQGTITTEEFSNVNNEFIFG